jgi:hypothetical protein
LVYIFLIFSKPKKEGKQDMCSINMYLEPDKKEMYKMDEIPVRKKRERTVVEETVELKIELSAKFFDMMEKAKKDVAKRRGYDISYGKYIEEAMEDLVDMVKGLEREVIKRDYENKLPSVVDKTKEDIVPPESNEEAPEHLYGHIIEDGAKQIMYQ